MIESVGKFCGGRLEYVVCKGKVYLFLVKGFWKVIFLMFFFKVCIRGLMVELYLFFRDEFFKKFCLILLVGGLLVKFLNVVKRVCILYFFVGLFSWFLSRKFLNFERYLVSFCM